MLTQRVHLQLLPQADLLQAVIEAGFTVAAAACSWRQREDAHDLPFVSASQDKRVKYWNIFFSCVNIVNTVTGTLFQQYTKY